jgi:hypothetical protein
MYLFGKNMYVLCIKDFGLCYDRAHKIQAESNLVFSIINHCIPKTKTFIGLDLF